MNLRLQIILLGCMVLGVLFIVNLLRKKKLDFKFGLGWLLVIVCLMILVIFPKLLIIISRAMGIASPVNMLFFFGFCLAVVIIFSLSMTVSILADKVKKLSQEIAIIRKDMYTYYQKTVQDREEP